MNRHVRKSEDKIRTLDLNQHFSLLGRSSHNSQKRTIDIVNPSSIIRPRTALNQQYASLNSQKYPQSGKNRASPHNTRTRWNLMRDEQDDMTESKHDNEDQFLVLFRETQQHQQQKQLQFVKSFHSWLKETLVQEHQSARMVNTIGSKKIRLSQKSKKQHTLDFKALGELFNKEYQPPNLFPCRVTQSIKRMQKKSGNVRLDKPVIRNKSEGQLKKKLITNFTKIPRNTSKPQRKRPSPDREIDIGGFSLLRTFSNPKIRSIQNGQLVTGTRITLIN